jgi:alkyl hydroperoxide reductase subunit AhpF
MAFLSVENQNEIKEMFSELAGDVQLQFFTQRESPIIMPGEDCPTCSDTRELLQEVVALSSKLHLEVHEVSANGDTEHNIQRIPAVVMSGGGVHGKVRYFGLPSGYEFSVLIGSILDASKAQADLSDETMEVLSGLDKDLQIQVFVTPT